MSFVTGTLPPVSGGELKVHDYWFLGLDLMLSFSEEGLQLETRQAVHHYVAYRSRRAIREFVDDSPQSVLIIGEALQADAFDELWDRENKLARKTHANMVQ